MAPFADRERRRVELCGGAAAYQGGKHFKKVDSATAILWNIRQVAAASFR
jgi:hypothetical protein